jgi:protein-L-isoaspartate O-methyltransferase
MPELKRAHERMVNVQIAGRGIRDRDVLEDMRHVPRESFVEPGYEEFAYEDSTLPIGEGQTSSLR